MDIVDEHVNEEGSFSHDLTEPMSFVENPVLESIIDQFITASQLRLSSFLRKKLFIKFESISSCHFQDITHDYTKLFMLNFFIRPHEKYALISFDFTFLHTIIDLLYGGVVSEDETVMTSLGKSGIKIANKIASLFLEVWQQYMVEELKHPIKFESISPQLSPVFKQSKTKKCYKISLKILIDSVVSHVHFVIPEMIFSPLEREQDSNSTNSQNPNQQEDIPSPLIFDDKLKEELIDSAVIVRFNLPDVTLKLKEVIHLKKGDIIPIDDPKNVMVVVNNKKVFAATAGQAEQRRVVKILNRVQ